MNMTRRTGASARAQALAKAADAVARRDAERIAREKAVQDALAHFFQAEGEVARLRAEADQAAAPFDAAMRDAVRALDRLGETRAGIAELTSVALTRVREYLVESAPAVSRDRSEPAQALGRGRAAGDETRLGRESVAARSELTNSGS